MAGDFYDSLEELLAAETKGEDYEIESSEGEEGGALIMAPHGGGIEGGTTELAREIAKEGDHSYYSFMGIKPTGNSKLHVTSTRFVGEEECMKLLARSQRVVALHGVAAGREAFVGGKDEELRDRIVAALKKYGIPVSTDSPEGLGGTHDRNVCNRGASGAGVQIEIAQSLRKEMFKDSLSAAARADEDRRAPLFKAFVAAIREALDED